MRAALLLLAVVVAPTGAAAQHVTTSCYSHKNRVTCYSDVSPGLGQSVANLVGLYQERRNEKIRAEWQRSLEQQRQAEEARLLTLRDPRNQDPEFQRFRVAGFISSGDCPGARRYAVTTGNPAMTARVKEFCGQ